MSAGNELIAAHWRTLTVCRGDAFSEGAERVHVATMLATIVVRPAAEAV